MLWFLSMELRRGREDSQTQSQTVDTPTQPRTIPKTPAAHDDKTNEKSRGAGRLSAAEFGRRSTNEPRPLGTGDQSRIDGPSQSSRTISMLTSLGTCTRM